MFPYLSLLAAVPTRYPHTSSSRTLPPLCLQKIVGLYIVEYRWGVDKLSVIITMKVHASIKITKLLETAIIIIIIIVISYHHLSSSLSFIKIIIIIIIYHHHYHHHNHLSSSSIIIILIISIRYMKETSSTYLHDHRTHRRSTAWPVDNDRSCSPHRSVHQTMFGSWSHYDVYVERWGWYPCWLCENPPCSSAIPICVTSYHIGAVWVQFSDSMWLLIWNYILSDHTTI